MARNAARRSNSSLLKQLGFNGGVAAGVVALLIGLGSLAKDWVTPFLADKAFGLTDHVVQQVKTNKQIVDLISANVLDRALADIAGKIDAGYSISVNFVPQLGEDGGFVPVTDSQTVAFHAKKGQRVCVAQQPVFNGLSGAVDIRIDGKVWRTVESHEDWDAPTDVTSFVSFDGGFRAVHIHEVELVPNLDVESTVSRAFLERGGLHLQPSTFMKLVILVYKGDQRECLE